MFGHHDDQDQPQDGSPPPEPAQDAPVPAAPPPSDNPPPAAPPPADDQPSPDIDTDLAAPDGPVMNENVISPAGGFPKTPSFPKDPHPITPAADSADTEATSSAPDLNSDETDELITIKQEALNELSPIIDKLDQTPEERFRTLMMMIQASDNQHLIKRAFESVHGIDDEKVKAQALLDIINEVNYFTMPHDGQDQPPTS